MIFSTGFGLGGAAIGGSGVSALVGSGVVTLTGSGVLGFSSTCSGGGGGDLTLQPDFRNSSPGSSIKSSITQAKV